LRFFDGDGVCYAFWCEGKSLWRSVDGKSSKIVGPIVFEVDEQGFGEIWDGNALVCSTSRKQFEALRPLIDWVGGIGYAEAQKKPFNPEGTWDLIDQSDGTGGSYAFVCFDPEGGSYCYSFNNGKSAEAYAWTFEVKGRNISAAKIEGVGALAMNITTNGTSGTGSLGGMRATINRRSIVYADATAFAVGTWEFYHKSQEGSSEQGAAYTMTLDENMSGWLYAAAAEFQEWTYKIEGHVVSADVPGIGKLSVNFAIDGTLGTAKVGPTRFNVWRKASN
jgi:hypothetical protein